jgi:hypothetical protein
MDRDERAKEAARLYNERWTYELIAQQLGCSIQAVYNDLQRLGVPKRPRLQDVRQQNRDQAAAQRFLRGWKA